MHLHREKKKKGQNLKETETNPQLYVDSSVLLFHNW